MFHVDEGVVHGEHGVGAGAVAARAGGGRIGRSGGSILCLGRQLSLAGSESIATSALVQAGDLSGVRGSTWSIVS